MVEVAESPGSLQGNLVPQVPSQEAAFLPVQCLPEASVSHVLVNQEVGLFVGAECEESDDVPVPDVA